MTSATLVVSLNEEMESVSLNDSGWDEPIFQERRKRQNVHRAGGKTETSTRALASKECVASETNIGGRDSANTLSPDAKSDSPLALSKMERSLHDIDALDDRQAQRRE